jgi:hypothetical protein
MVEFDHSAGSAAGLRFAITVDCDCSVKPARRVVFPQLPRRHHHAPLLCNVRLHQHLLQLKMCWLPHPLLLAAAERRGDHFGQLSRSPTCRCSGCSSHIKLSRRELPAKWPGRRIGTWREVHRTNPCILQKNAGLCPAGCEYWNACTTAFPPAHNTLTAHAGAVNDREQRRRPARAQPSTVEKEPARFPPAPFLAKTTPPTRLIPARDARARPSHAVPPPSAVAAWHVRTSGRVWLGPVVGRSTGRSNAVADACMLTSRRPYAPGAPAKGQARRERRAPQESSRLMLARIRPQSCAARQGRPQPGIRVPSPHPPEQGGGRRHRPGRRHPRTRSRAAHAGRAFLHPRLLRLP